MSNLVMSLNIMWKGMLAIFVVMILIIICVKLLTRFTKHEEQRNELRKDKRNEAS